MYVRHSIRKTLNVLTKKAHWGRPAKLDAPSVLSSSNFYFTGARLS